MSHHDVSGAPSIPEAPEQLSLLSCALDQIGEAIFLMEGESPSFIYVNGAATAHLGYSREELTGGMGVFDIDPDMTEELWQELLPRVRAQRRVQHETTHRTADGRLVPVEISASVFQHGGRWYNLAVARDISERREVERALRASEEAYRTLVDNTPDMIIRWDRSLKRLLVNNGFLRMLGQSREAILAGRYGEGHPADNLPALAETRRAIERVFALGESEVLDTAFVTTEGKSIMHIRLVPERDAAGEVTTVLGIGRDITPLRESERQLRSLMEHSPDIILRFDREGRYLYANTTLERLTGVPVSAHIGRPFGSVSGTGPPELYARMRKRIGEVFTSRAAMETELILPITTGPKEFNVRLIPELQDDGEVASVLAVVRDVTDRRQLEQQLRQSQKMEAVGRLAGGIAHDFNNILAVIQMQSTLLGDQPGTPLDVREGLQEILAATERAANLTRQLLTFSRHHVARPVDLYLSETIASMTRLLRRVLGEDVALETRYAPALPLVHADPGMLEQVVMNLAINARDAMPTGGRLMMMLSQVAIGPERAALHPGASPGLHLCLTVEDTGKGIPPEALPRIFEPFFTTKEVGKGTGLGLATVFGIIGQHHGWIEVESTVGAGTTFWIFLPAVVPDQADDVAGPADLSPPAVRGGSETIMLVEDDAAVRSSARTALDRHGYRVLVAPDAARAKEVWQREGTGVQLLVTDLVMPGGMSGHDLAVELRRERPDLRVLYITGYSAELEPRSDQDPGSALLQKPFGTTDLAIAVRRMLDG